ncbi:hypothetical protein TUN205_09992 [Pyrenophora tritici-repentis]|nr:hypothetical protein TUN205_09992 [Pyrenophora tritici-repentis]
MRRHGHNVAPTVDLADPNRRACYQPQRFPWRDIVGDIIRGALTFVLKTQHSPDLRGLSDALNVARTEARATAESTAQTLDQIKQELRSTVELVKQSATKIQ